MAIFFFWQTNVSNFCSAKAPLIFSAKNIRVFDFMRPRRLNKPFTYYRDTSQLGRTGIDDLVKMTERAVVLSKHIETQRFK